MKDYPRDGLMHCHNHWHMALWSMETGRHADAWRIYDEALRPGAAWGPQVNVATDCPAFLLRAEMAGQERKPELWRELADYSTKWFGRPGLSFVDMHTVLAYAMAGDDDKLAAFSDSPRGAAGDMVPPMARGFAAFARGDWKTAADEIEPLLATHERLGGSRAQRDLLEYVVTAAKLRAGQRDEARRISKPAARKTPRSAASRWRGCNHRWYRASPWRHDHDGATEWRESQPLKALRAQPELLRDQLVRAFALGEVEADRHQHDLLDAVARRVILDAGAHRLRASR